MLDSDEDPRYNNWRRLWERKKRPRRRLALAWLRRLSYSPTSHQAPSIPPQNFELLSSTPMADDPSNLPIEDQFLRWRQDMERKLDDQARQMTDLRLLSERLQQENNRLLEREHARLQERQSGDENPRDDPRGSGNPSPLPIRRKGKEPALQADPDTLADDELSSGNSPLPGHSAVRLTGGASRGPPPITNPRAGTRRNASRHPGRSTSRAHYRPERERGHDPIAQPPTEAPFYLPSAPPTEHHTLPPRGHRRMLSSPFGRHIMEYDPPRGFTVPPFVRFDGSSDPYDHMMHYNQAMILSTGNDPLLCKIFPASLKGPALAWFHKLPPYSVNSFDDLWEVFTTQYLCSVRQKGSISSLQTILRREDESIRDFTRRFGQAVQQVESCSMDTILQNFRRSFAPSTPFFQALSLKPPPTMEDLYKKADRYATLEDNTRAATQAVVITSPTTETEAPAAKASSGSKGRQDKGQKRAYDQTREKKDLPSFTPLNITYDRLLPLIRDLPDFKRPFPIRADPEHRNRSLRCEFHQDHGHETNNCRSLKFLVEKLIRAGHLRRYILEVNHAAEPKSPAERVGPRPDAALLPRPMINFIIGGPADDRYRSKNQRKKIIRAAAVKARINTVYPGHAQSQAIPVDGPISFAAVDPNRVLIPHSDALVLTLCINDFDVGRVLIDPGSAADLLQLPVLRQMKLSPDKLTSAGRMLSGFNGATTTTLGDVTFAVKAGPVTQQVLFSVVQDLGPYNAIMGRNWLHNMKAVPSTYHQTLSYLTNAGQVDLLSSQLAARQCYSMSLQEPERERIHEELPLENPLTT